MISNKKIYPRNDMMLLRITPDAKSVAIFHSNFYTSLSIHSLDDSSIASVFRRKEAHKDDKISEIFDISPDGRFLAVCYDEVRTSEIYGMECYIWDIQHKVYLPSFISKTMEYKSYVANGRTQRGHAFLDVHFLPDNDRLVLVTEIGEIFVWSISQQKQLWAVSAAAHLADSVAFSHKFGLFAMLDLQMDGWRYGVIGQHTTSYDKILYQKYGQWVGSEPLNFGHSFRLWNTYSGTLIREFDADYAVSDLVFSHEDKLIAGSMKQTAFIWDVNTGELVDALPENTQPIGFTANDQYLITIHESNSIGLWDLQVKQWHQHYQVDGMISSAQVSQNDIVVALSKTINDWQLHQIQLS